MKKQNTIAIAALFCAAASLFAMPQKATDITVSGYTGSSTLENFPVLVRIAEYDAETGKGIQGFSYADCATGGADISFVSPDGATILAHEIDTWNPEGESLVWVRVPSLSGTATSFTFRWNDANPPSVTASAVWSANYIGVWHFSEEGGDATDATGHGLTGVETGSSSLAPASKVGGARAVASGALQVPDYEATYGGATVFSASGWFYCPGVTAGYRAVLNKKTTAGAAWNSASGWYLEMNNSLTQIGLIGCNSTKYTCSIPNITQGWNYFHIVSSGSNVKLYLNGSTSPGINKDHALKAAGVPLNMMPTVGYADEFRIRSIANSADWTAAEYRTVAIADFLTYGTARSLAGDFLVTGAPEAVGSPTPAYGTYGGTAAGASIPVQCPVWTNETGTAVYSCAGWKLYNGEGEVVDSGTGSAFTYVHPTPAAYRRLEWQWRKSGKVPSSTGGSVSGTLVYAPGDTVTLTATPAEGNTFFRWTGDIGNADPAEPTITFTANSSDPVTALFGTQLVVASDGSGDYTSLNAAVAAAPDNATILVRDGTYVNDTAAFLEISKPIKIVSENGCDTTFFRSSKNPNGSNVINVNPAYKGIQVNNSLAIVKGITFFNFGCDGSQTPQGLGVYLQNGLVENCVISNTLPNHGGSALHITGGEARHLLVMKNTSRDGRNGAGVYMTGGTVTNCVIRNNSAPNGGGAYVDGANAKLLGCEIFSNSGTGGGVYLANGLVSDCVITNNSGSAGGVRQTGGTLANCLVARNKSSYAQSCGGVNSTGGVITNCTILANTAYDAAGRQLVKTAGDLRDTIVGEGMHAIPSKDIVTVADGVIVSGCAIQCPGITGATLLNASQVFGEAAPRIVADKTVGLTNLVVSFSAECGGATAWAWDFGAAATPATSSEAAPTATFATPGRYPVSVTVTTQGGSETLSLEIRALATDAYVSKTGSATFPYDTPEKATGDLNAAAAAVYADDAFAGTVHVAADTYTFGEASRTGTFAPWILVNKAVRVEGPGPGDATFDAAQKTMNLFLFHPRAIVSGLTFHRGKYSTNAQTYGGNLHMTAGLVTNCAFTSGYCPYGGQATMRGGEARDCTFSGGSLAASGTDRHAGGLNVYADVLVADCLICNNSGCFGGGLHVNAANAVVTNCVLRGNSASGCGGGGVNLLNGLVTHCVFTNNSTGAAGGGVQMKGGTLRNCVVAGNRSTHTGSSYGADYNKAGGGGLNITGGTAENCTFYGDSSASATRCDELSMSGGTVRNCIFVGTDATASFDVRKSGGTATYCFFRTEVAGTGNITGDAKLKAPASGDFSLLYGSPCLDTGMEIAAVTTDIRGEARPKDGNDDETAAWDMGAYEMDFTGQMVASFEADVTTGGGETAVTLTATVTGGTAPYTYTWTIGGETIIRSTPTLTYTFSYGAHDVSLVVTDADNNESETVTRASLVSIKSPVVHVSTTGTGVWPYDTWEKATDDWTAALTAVYSTDATPGTVLVADGTYTAHDGDVFTANLAIPVVFMGTNSACGAVFNGQGNIHKALGVNHPKALVANLTISNCKGGYGENCGAMWLYQGIVSNCVFTGGGGNGGGLVLQMGGLLCDSVLKNHDAGGDAGADRFAGGLYMTGGVAERLVISGNADGTAGGVRVNGETAVLRDSVIRNNTSSDGGAVLVDDGLVENCVISNNTNTAVAGHLVTDIAGAGATVRGGTLRNCLIVGNRSTGGGAQPTAGALFVKSGSAYNNSVWANTLSTDATNDIYQVSGTAKNNIAGVFATVGGTAGHNYAGDDPGFKNVAAGDWRLRSGSPCVNAGDWTVWGATRAEAKACRDFAGAPRLVGPNVDQGCFEAQTSFTMLMLR
jgi:hypothetical protein